MSRKKISTTIYVTPEQSDKLKLLHERTKVPVAVYIREGIDLVLRHYSHLLPGQLPLGGTEAAEKADKTDKADKAEKAERAEKEKERDETPRAERPSVRRLAGGQGTGPG